MKALTNEWENTAAGERELSRDELVVKYLPLVRYVFGRLSLHLPNHLDAEDLIGAGVIGLVQAADRFDRSREIKFNTYAVPRIRGAMLDELRNHDPVPRSARDKASRVDQARSKLRERWDRDPTVDEMAKELNVEPGQVERLLRDVQFASEVPLDSTVSDDPDEPGGTGHCLADPSLTDPADACEHEERNTLLSEALARLPKRQRVVVTLYYFEDLLLKEIGEILEISESRVSQLRATGVGALRAMLEHMATALVG